MANLTTKIKLYLGTDVDFTKDVIVNDDDDACAVSGRSKC